MDEPDQPPQPGGAGTKSPDAGRAVEALTASGALGDTRAWDASDRLVRLALLITGSPDRAHRLARATLVAVGPDAQYQQARRRLLRRVTRVRTNPYTAAMLPGLAGHTPAARLWRRLMALSVQERALVVLTEAEGMPDSVAGAALGLPRGENESALRRVRDALQTHTQLTQAERREVLGGPALQLGGGVLPESVLRREQRSRKLRRGGTAVVAAALAVLLWATNGATGADPVAPRGEVPTRYTGETDRLAEPAQWNARGRLLDDESLLASSLATWRANGLDTGGSRPVVLWAGSVSGDRLVVLAGEDRDGEHVVGAVLRRGGGTDLVSLQRSGPTLAVGFTGLDEDRPDARRYLVAPWVSTLALNDVASSEPTGAAEFVNLDLSNGLSAPWSRPSEQVEVLPTDAIPRPGGGSDDARNTCGRPLLRLTGAAPPGPDPTAPNPTAPNPTVSATPTVSPTGSPTATPQGAEPAGSEVDLYALDVGDAPVLSVAEPPATEGNREMYLGAVRGLTSCEGRAPGGFDGGLADRVDLDTALLSDLQVVTLWSGTLPDGTPGQVFQVTWNVSRHHAEDLSALSFAVASANAPAQYATVTYAAEADQLRTTLAGVIWRSGRDKPAYLVVAGGPGLARVDLAPRPPQFRGGGRIGFVPAPAPGRQAHAVGADPANRVVVSRLVP